MEAESGKRRWLKILLLVAMLAGTCLASALLTVPDWPYPPPRLGLLSLALLVQLGAVLLRAWNWTQLLSLIRPAPLRVAAHATLIGMACNGILPLRLGELVRAYLLGNALGVSRLAIFATVAIERAFDLAILGTLCLATAIALRHNGMSGVRIMEMGGCVLLAVALALGGLINLVGSRRSLILRTMGKMTALFNDEWRDKLRIGLWSIGHFLRILRTNPARLASFAGGLTLIWICQITALLLLFAALHNYTIPITAFGEALGAYLAIGVPAAPAFVGSYQPIFSMTAQAIDPDLMHSVLSINTLGFMTWALMVVPVTLAGLVLMLIKPGFGFRRSVTGGTAGSRQLMRDWPRSQEMSDFLRSYFAGVSTIRAAEDQELRGRGATLRQFKGGSDAITLLIETEGGLCVRKIAPKERMAKLAAQRDWLLRHQATHRLPRVLGWLDQDGFVQLDVEMFAAAESFFDVIHSINPERSAEMLFELLALLNEKIYGTGAQTEDPDALRNYIDHKISGKIDAAILLVPELAALHAAPRLAVNGVTINSINGNLARIFASPNMLSDLSRFQPADIHGDLTVDNLLVADSRLLMIDPNNENAIQDAVVDLGKLCQSLHSGYEFLIGVDHIRVNGHEIDFPDRRSLRYASLYQLLDDHLKSTLPPSRYRTIRFHEAVHFTRMLTYRARIDPSTTPMYYAVAALRLDEFCRFYDA